MTYNGCESGPWGLGVWGGRLGRCEWIDWDLGDTSER